MAKLKLTSEIVDQDTKVFLSWDGFESTSSDDVVKFIESIPADDNKIDVHIHCVGGQVFEGLRMYDALRQSGKEISCVVEGLCASMATIILMAAPKERRYSYANSTFLIHNPEVSGVRLDYPNRLTADELDGWSEKMRLQAGELRDLQNRLIDIYVERTGTDRETFQKLMDENVTIGAQRAIEIGLINETLAHNTASLNNRINMNKKDNKTEVKASLLDRILAKAGFKSLDDVKFSDLSFTAADGNTFTVEREEGLYAVGDNASPDGKFVMEDGSTVNIENGVITDIIPAKMEIKNPVNGEVISEEEAQQMLNNYEQQVNDLKAKLEEKEKEAMDMTDKLTAANTTIAEKDNEITALRDSQINDEQKDILTIVAEAGGKVWLDAMKGMQSKGEPQLPQNNPNVQEPQAKIGEGFLNDMKKSSGRIFNK